MMKISIVILASGYARRFGSNKLLFDMNGKTMIEHVFQTIAELENDVVVISSYDEIFTFAKKYHFHFLFNQNAHLGISESVKLGTNYFKESDAILFVMGDQPFIQKESFIKMMKAADDFHLLRACVNDVVSTPTLIPKRYFSELLEITKDEGGRVLMRKYPKRIKCIEFSDKKEFIDIDEIKDIIKIGNKKQ